MLIMRLPSFPEWPLAAHELPELEYWMERTSFLYRIVPYPPGLKWLRRRDWREVDEALERCHRHRRQYDRARREYEHLVRMLNDSTVQEPLQVLASLQACITAVALVCHSARRSYRTIAYFLSALEAPRCAQGRAALRELCSVIETALSTPADIPGSQTPLQLLTSRKQRDA